MAANSINHLQTPMSGLESGCDSGREESSCWGCREISKKIGPRQGSSESVPIGQVLLVFFLPLVCAAAVVIWAVHSWPVMAEHPGYLALTALGVVCGALILAKVLTRGKIRQAKNNQTEKTEK